MSRKVRPVAPPPPPMRSFTRPLSQRLGWRQLVIFALTVVSYASAAQSPLLFDDATSIVSNASIRQLTPLQGPLSPPRDTPVAGRPIVNVTFAINYATDGLGTRGYHVTNIAIHVVVAFLLFALVRRGLRLPRVPAALTAQADNLAFATAIIWAVHPLNSEVVNYLTQRSESLMALFYVLTVYAAIRALDEADEVRWTVVAVLACVAGMASKESMVTAPLMVVLIDRVMAFDSWREAAWKRRSLYTGLAAGWVVLGAILWTVPRTSAGFTGLGTSWTYLLNQAQLIPRYIGLAFWPRPLVLDYGVPEPLTFGMVWPGFFLLVILFALAVVALRRWPLVGILGAWFFITLAPASSIIPVATEVGAERRMYLPLMALVLLVVLAVNAALERWPAVKTRVATGLLVATCALLALGLQLRNREYASPLTMAQTIVDRWPNGRGHFLLASELVSAGRQAEALAQFRESAKTFPGALFALGTELVAAGDLVEGTRSLESYISLQPDHPVVIPAREILSRIYLQQERLPDAQQQLQQLLKRVPNHAAARRLMGDLRMRQQDPAGAVTEYRESLRVEPNQPDTLGNLGYALSAINRFDEAAEALRQVVAMTPTDPGAHLLLGRVLAVLKKYDEALAEFQAAVQLDPENRDAKTNLASLQRLMAQTPAVAPAGGAPKP